MRSDIALDKQKGCKIAQHPDIMLELQREKAAQMHLVLLKEQFSNTYSNLTLTGKAARSAPGPGAVARPLLASREPRAPGFCCLPTRRLGWLGSAGRGGGAPASPAGSVSPVSGAGDTLPRCST